MKSQEDVKATVPAKAAVTAAEAAEKAWNKLVARGVHPAGQVFDKLPQSDKNALTRAAQEVIDGTPAVTEYARTVAGVLR